jgi:hypothetical protein
VIPVVLESVWPKALASLLGLEWRPEPELPELPVLASLD